MAGLMATRAKRSRVGKSNSASAAGPAPQRTKAMTKPKIFSPEARAKMSEASKRRWARYRQLEAEAERAHKAKAKRR